MLVTNAVPLGGGPLFTVTLTDADVTLPPLPSEATAFSVCTALLSVVVSSVKPNGDEVAGLPAFTPSTCNCTLATGPPVVTVTAVLAPEIVAPAAGAVIEIVSDGAPV
jgi:hypothetical protein